MSFNRDKYRLACAQYRQTWQAIDEALYELCRRHADHQSQGGINAKLWIIGRTYATGIERKIISKKTQGSSMEQLSAHLWNHRDEVDEVLTSLRTVSEPLTSENLAKILAAHGRLVGIVQEILRKGQTPRSFVSKYLHFHNPAVPIFDSVAVRAATRHYRRERNGPALQIPIGAEPQYTDFLFRFWRLYKEAMDTGQNVKVKLLDYYLLALAKEGA
jgi:hypothetical protein